MEKFNFTKVENIVFPMLNKEGVEHTKKIVNFAMLIAKEECPNNTCDVLLAAYLQDIVPDNNILKENNQHAIKAALIAEEILEKHFPEYNSRKILHSIRYHEDERITKDPIIGAVWDANLLEKNKKDINLFSTARGIELALMQ